MEPGGEMRMMVACEFCGLVMQGLVMVSRMKINLFL